jgi:hypothetical protein
VRASAPGCRALRLSTVRLESLASPAFIAALALLVLNDFALKPLFHNALTGKLSDFAGLFALTLFATTLWPRCRRLAAVVIGASFTFWKTSWVEPLIDLLNVALPFTVGRTVDVTDLVALPMIPLAVWVAPRIRPWPLPTALRFGLAAFALVAFTATSRARYVARDTMDVTKTVAVDEASVQALFDGIADERGLRCEVCVPLSEGRVYVPDGDSDVRALIVRLDQRQTLLFTVTGYDRRRGVRALARHVRREIEARFPAIVVIDRTDNLFTVAEGETTLFVIRLAGAVPEENAKRALSSIVESVARGHGLDTDTDTDTDTASATYYLGDNQARPEYRDFVLMPILDRRDLLLVRLSRRSATAAALHRAVTEEITAGLEAEFGAESVTVHDVPAAPPEYAF